VTRADGVRKALTRFRVMAWITGVSLLVLVTVIMPIRYIGGNETPSEYFSPFHGLMYFLYVATAFDLTSRMRWGLGRLILIMLAGCVPLVSFVAERRVTRDVEDTLPTMAEPRTAVTSQPVVRND
jgi:integral membrane protein